jgi:excisionase family DNA binding protein
MQSISFQADIPDEFIDRIAERVFEKLRPIIVGASRKEDETIYDVKGLASYLSTTEQWVRDKARAGEIPCFKSGKYWKFHKRQIDRFYQSRALIPVSAVKGRA